ncbi:MAG: sulfurtransferase-like selenium metabolism protein YedF [Desulfotignum sp.]|nr:sulfurtransferase-like selenium metabolism protein YedF [Desulfotignum sp.]MCF8126849.1 sulfurtransferase-like selenium metabolism protein YedF [Desulfotignum sp.]
MTTDVDARGLACPQPVLKTKQTVDQSHPSQLTVQVDNEAAVENVSRFLGTQGYDTTVSGQKDDFTITAVLTHAPPGQAEETDMGPGPDPSVPEADDPDVHQKILVLIATDRMGFGDDELGKKLMISFIKTLGEMGDDLWRLVFVNNGVKLTITGSPVLETLKAYEKQGISILVCGTCLSHFDLLEARQVGYTTNMLDIVTSLQLAQKVIQP